MADFHILKIIRYLKIHLCDWDKMKKKINNTIIPVKLPNISLISNSVKKGEISCTAIRSLLH